MTTISFLGYKISNQGAAADAHAAMALVTSTQRGSVVSTLNPHSVIIAKQNAGLAQALQAADLLLPDGIGVVMGGRLLGQSIPERVAGYDFFQAMSQLAQAKGDLSYYFIGSSDAVLQKITHRLAAEYPGIRLAGVLSPPFKAEFSEEENIAMCDKINAARPDVLWVGMTAPKQEIWIQQNRHRLDVGCAAAIGAVFDFYAGTKARAPQWVQRLGCEWLYRFYLEPRRMWRRYLVSTPRFVAMVMREKFRGAELA